MSRVLVIPDVHLKPWIFDLATALLKEGKADFAMFIGDLVDDWNQTSNIKLYTETIDRAIKFKEDFPNSLWCYGNHEVAYMINDWCSGNSEIYRMDIKSMLNKYERIVEPKLVHIIDNVVFSHAGVEAVHKNLENINDFYNLYSAFDFNNSPLWSRPDPWIKYYDICQVAGHSPVKEITHQGNLWLVDTFSTEQDGTPYGNQPFLVIDTESLAVTIYDTKQS